MVRNDDRKTDQVFLDKGFGFNPLHNGRLSGSDLNWICTFERVFRCNIGSKRELGE